LPPRVPLGLKFLVGTIRLSLTEEVVGDGQAMVAAGGDHPKVAVCWRADAVPLHRSMNAAATGGVQLLILDCWGLEPLDTQARHDLPEILEEERYGQRSTVVTSQLPGDKWHDVIRDATYADAILDHSPAISCAANVRPKRFERL
jgi:hypothetical protein